MKKIAILLICALVATCAWAESLDSTLRKGEITVELWPNGAPHDNGVDYSGKVETRSTYKPQLHVFLPQSKTPTKAVVICPGGAYSVLAVWHEGYQWRPFFNRENFACIVLTYRMPHHNDLVPAEDVYQAFRIIKEHAAEWNIDPNGIGIMGFSAGGHLASTVATHAPADVRPAFQILFYPVISTDAAITHMGSRNNLLGKNPSAEKLKYYSNELQVTKDTPTAFIIAADDDNAVPVQNSVRYYAALKKFKIPAVLQIYPKGGHGFGINDSFPSHDSMMQNLADFLRNL